MSLDYAYGMKTMSNIITIRGNTVRGTDLAERASPCIKPQC